MPQYKIIAATAVTEANKVGNARLKPGWSMPSLILSRAFDEDAMIPFREFAIGLSTSIFSTLAILHLSNRHIHDVFIGTECLVTDVQSKLKCKRANLLTDHHFRKIIFQTKLIVSR